MTENARAAPGGRLGRCGAAALAGAVAALGHAPFDLWPITPLGLAALLLIAGRRTGVRDWAWLFWAAGTGYFAVSLHWIVEPFFVDAATHGWMAPFALALMAGGMALFWALAGGLAARVAPPGPLRMPFALVLLVLAEAARAQVFTGFPWAHPGHVLIASDLLALAAWTGPHGLTAVTLAVAGGLAWFAARRSWIGAAALSIGFAMAGVLPGTPAAPVASADAPVVRLIQPNAPQDQKWLPEMIPVFFQRGLTLTAAASEGPAPDLVIWPETSLPVLLDRSETARARLAQAAGAPLIIGAQRFDGTRAANTLVLLDADGAIDSVYDKHHLVPFGEYLPFDDLMSRIGLRGLAALPVGYRAGPGPAVLDLGARLGRSFAMICYEAIFPGYIRQVARPDWMVHITNDAWFGQFSGPYQHLALARLRAAEQGLPVLRAANTGISAVIDARGGVVAALPLGVSGHLDAPLPPPLPATAYARLGDGPVLGGALLLALILAGLARLRGPLRPRI